MLNLKVGGRPNVDRDDPDVLARRILPPKDGSSGHGTETEHETPKVTDLFAEVVKAHEIGHGQKRRRLVSEFLERWRRVPLALQGSAVYERIYRF